MYWAQEVAAQTQDAELAAEFKPLAEALTANEQKIVDELNAVQGKPAELEGYYHIDLNAVAKVMRPSATFNQIMDSFKK